MTLERYEYLAVRLILAYMETDDVMLRAAYVWEVRAASGFSDDNTAFDLASVTAWEAARFWRDTNPELGRKLLNAKLDELTAAGVPA